MRVIVQKGKKRTKVGVPKFGTVRSEGEALGQKGSELRGANPSDG